MEEIGVDNFNSLGTNWLVAVDRCSCYAWTAKIAKATTENTLTQLVAWFDEFGWQKKIRSDGGPQFRHAFTSFCKLHGFSHELASAYNQESNRLAEAAVKSMKALVVQTKKMGENLRQAIACWRNMKSQNGSSPAELFWGRTHRLRLPLHNASQPAPHEDNGPTRRYDLHTKQIKARNQHTTSYLPLKPGDTALLADGTTGKWTKVVTILSTNPNGKSYQVQDSRGHTYTRGRELLRKRIRRPNLEPPLTSRQFKETELINTTEQKDARLGRTYRCPRASCQIRQTQTATTTAWSHAPQQHPSEERGWTRKTCKDALRSSRQAGGEETNSQLPSGRQQREASQHSQTGGYQRSDGMPAATGGHADASGTGSSDSEASNCIILVQTLTPPGPTWTPNSERLLYKKERTRPGEDTSWHCKGRGAVPPAPSCSLAS